MNSIKRTFSIDAVQKIGLAVMVEGWVQNRRDHGGLIFIDLRDHTGIIQLVINPDQAESFKLAEHIRDEYVLRVVGDIQSRAKDLINPKLATGKIELRVKELVVLNKSEPLPLSLFGEINSSEEQRFKYRYLDLRTSDSQMILKKRSELYKIMRRYMDKNDFTEVTTPILANSSPEGARDFLVPSRVHPGKFYALPQSPQQFKQLLMVGGLHRYYQIATCFRDEDPRADRLYGDFYHLDLEMSFVEDGEEVRSTMEPLIVDLVTNFAHKKLHSKVIPRIKYNEALDLYGTDKPDLRFGLELMDVSEVFTTTDFSIFKNVLNDGGIIKAIKAPKGALLSRSQIDQLTQLAISEGAKGLAYIQYKDQELKSPILKFLSTQEQKDLINQVKLKDGDIVFFGAGTRKDVNKVLGVIRNALADELKLKDDQVVSLAWIVDFPLYEWDDTNNRLDFGHNPFSMPKGGIEALSAEDKLDILADQYDMVMNGYEICSGAVRNHHPEIMYKVFEAIGYQKEYVDQKFGAMVNAFKYGAPPHAGCAFGIDRIFMVLINKSNIREVVAFPKNGSGVDLMMNSPSDVANDQLRELNIKRVL
jgi:aspartyl-tRNA synthetase